jgi:hypothetical protein
MPELLAPRKVTSINTKGRFLTTSESLPQLSCQLPQVGRYCQLPEVVCQNCWLPAQKNQLTDGDSVSESSFIWLPPFLLFSCSIIIPQEQKLPLTEPHAGGRHRYNGVLPGAPKGSLTTLLSPLQYHAALSTIPHTLASVDQSPVRSPKTYPPP